MHFKDENRSGHHIATSLVDAHSLCLGSCVAMSLENGDLQCSRFVFKRKTEWTSQEGDWG